MEISFAPANASLAELIIAYRSDPVTARFNPLRAVTLEELRERLSKAVSDWSQFETAESMLWLVKSENQMIGTVSLQNINRMILTAEIGYRKASSESTT